MGIVGICCALSLQERGIPVRLIDRATPGQATSFGNAGVVSPWSFILQAMPEVWKKTPGMMLDKHRPLSVRKSYWHKMIPWGLRFFGACASSGPNLLRDLRFLMNLARPVQLPFFTFHNFAKHIRHKTHSGWIRNQACTLENSIYSPICRL